MRIRNGKTICCISGNLWRITNRYLYLLNGIDNLFARTLFIKIVPGISPAVGIIQGDCITRLFAICIKLYLNTCRTNSILVIAICPGLRHRDTRLAWRIAVCNIVAIDLYAVAIHCIFRNSVRDFFPILILRQILKLIRPDPISICLYHGAVNLRTIRKQVHGDTLRTLDVLIALIIPVLYTRDGDRFHTISQCPAIFN